MTDLGQLESTLRSTLRKTGLNGHAVMPIDFSRGSIIATLYPLDVADFTLLMDNLKDITCGVQETVMDPYNAAAVEVGGNAAFTGTAVYALGKTRNDLYCYQVLLGVAMTQAHMLDNGMVECSAATFPAVGKNIYSLGTYATTAGSMLSYTGGSGQWCPGKKPRSATVEMYADPYATAAMTRAAEPSTCAYAFQIALPPMDLPAGVYTPPNQTAEVAQTGVACTDLGVGKAHKGTAYQEDTDIKSGVVCAALCAKDHPNCAAYRVHRKRGCSLLASAAGKLIDGTGFVACGKCTNRADWYENSDLAKTTNLKVNALEFQCPERSLF